MLVIAPVILFREVCLTNVSYYSCLLFQGGSSGKGTSLRGRSDADLVVFLSPLTTFQDQLNRRGEFIQEIRKQLKACQRERAFSVKFEVQAPRWDNPRALSFVLSSPQLGEGVEFDVLPAFDALGESSQLLFLPLPISEQKSPTA